MHSYNEHTKMLGSVKHILCANFRASVEQKLQVNNDYNKQS
jgi:hypothetical protein